MIYYLVVLSARRFEMFDGLFGASMALLGLVLFIFGLVICFQYRSYKSGQYYLVTHKPFFSLYNDIGSLGEMMCYKYLRDFEKQGARFLFNLYLPANDGSTTELDGIMICKKGFVVIESKNYSGWIFGNEHQKTWTQVLPAGRGRSNKEHFYNPILQNSGHIKALGTLIEEDIPLFSVIVFSNRCTLKEIDCDSKKTPVVNRRDIFSAVTGLLETSYAELSQEKINGLYSLLYPYSQTDKETKERHVERIKEKHSETNNEKTCPRCGGKLVLRTAKRGENAGRAFYGCSNFPKCRYMEQTDKNGAVDK